MEIEVKKENSIPNIWKAQEHMIHFYRVLVVGLGALAVFLLVFVTVMSFRDPMVVIRSDSGQEFHPGLRAPMSIGKQDVENITRRFLETLYAWPNFDAQALAKGLGPYVEDALVEKIVETQTQKFGKDFKGKKLAQEITFINVNVLEDRVVCTFDRVLKIEGIPLLIPTEVTLSMLRGSPTRENPMGVFVSGILENEGAK